MNTRNSLVRKAGKYTLLFLSWTVCIVLSSFFSFESVELDTPDIPHLDKLVHFIFYFGFAILAGLAGQEVGLIQMNRKSDFLKILILAILFGTFIEVLQVTLTTWRSGDLLDAVANSIGALTGIGFMWYYRRNSSFPDWKN